MLGARWGRTRAIVLCPWRSARRKRRLRQICKHLVHLSPDEQGFYVDEVDIDLNPRFGPDWMLPNQQNRILAPGTNQTVSLAGRIRLHFLPPYCPDENRIELLWLQLHSNVARNHR